MTWPFDEESHALQAGIDAGYAIGYSDGWDDYGLRIDLWLGIVKSGLDAPTQRELERSRAYAVDRCSWPRCRGTCSRCTRAGVALRNRRRYGSDDYPGGPVEWTAAPLAATG